MAVVGYFEMKSLLTYTLISIFLWDVLIGVCVSVHACMCMALSIFDFEKFKSHFGQNKGLNKFSLEDLGEKVSSRHELMAVSIQD